MSDLCASGRTGKRFLDSWKSGKSAGSVPSRRGKIDRSSPLHHNNNGNLYSAFGNSKRCTITVNCGTHEKEKKKKKKKKKKEEEEATLREKKQ